MDDSEDAYEAQSEKEERKDELDQALESIGQDDQMPDYNTDRYNNQDTPTTRKWFMATPPPSTTS